jgi:hypothetical protein
VFHVSDKQDPKELQMMRGLLFALPFVFALWLVIAAISYGIYRIVVN